MKKLKKTKKYRVKKGQSFKLSARRVSNAVGIDDIHCGLKAEDKLGHLTVIQVTFQLLNLVILYA